MTRSQQRRDFLKTSAVIGAGYFAGAGVTPKASAAAIETVRFGCIGVGGKGVSDADDASKGGKIVACCDVDDNTLNAALKKYEGAKGFNDYREMLDKMGSEIDAVTVSMPDHMHAPASLKAMRMGKHVYCQKPLTRTIYEARRMGEVAREKKVVTQMGNQGTASDPMREGAAILGSGALGKISEVHIWTNRPMWACGGPRPPKINPPASLHWDLWLGVAPPRDFGPGYHPFSWRGWWDFGTGALGDMACHTVNMPYMGLALKDPTTVVAETSGHNRDSFPKWTIINFEFPGNDKRGPLKMVWYDGGKKPPRELFDDVALVANDKGEKENAPAASGALVIGDQGKLYSPGDYGGDTIRMSQGKEKPKVEWTHSPGHFVEFIEGIKGGPTPVSNFPDYGGPLTEVILLGNLAVWAAPDAGTGKKIEWDAKNLVATNAPEVMSLVKPTYPAGYEL
jgi:predicted dehydrogenase